jgi:hypothetical protein
VRERRVGGLDWLNTPPLVHPLFPCSARRLRLPRRALVPSSLAATAQGQTCVGAMQRVGCIYSVGRGDLARGGGWDGSSHEIRHFREADGLSIVREPQGRMVRMYFTESVGTMFGEFFYF